MRRFLFSDDDRLLSGDLDPDDAPPELARVAGLVRAARAPELSSELAGEELLVSQVAAIVRESRRLEVARDDRRHLLGKVLSAKVIGATAAVLLSGGVAAAATGALPTPVQEAVAHGLAHVGISIPDPATPHAPGQHTSGHPTSTTTASANGITPSTTTTNRYGLCTAYTHASTTKARANGLSKLTAAAQANGETVTQYCEGATPPLTVPGANPGSSHRPTTSTSVLPSTPAGKSTGHDSAGRGTQHRPTTTVTVSPSSKAHGGISSNGPAGKTSTGSTNSSASKNATASSAPARSSRGNSSTSSTTTTSTSLPANAQGHSSTSSDNEKGDSSAHTS